MASGEQFRVRCQEPARCNVRQVKDYIFSSYGCVSLVGYILSVR